MLNRIAPRTAHQHADPPYPVALLRPRRKRPRRHRTAEKRDELATAAHSITSSASASSLSGMARRSFLAVWRLITSSNLVGWMTGRLDGFAPAIILPAYTPIWRYASGRCGP